MPRKARQKSHSGIYHVVIKGIDRQLMFESTSDYRKYIEILETYKEKCNFKIYAYCLMSNHVHLLIHVSPHSCTLESVFRHINTHYAVWFNMKYDRTGALQQGRYYSEPVETSASLWNIIRYIHQNPLKAGLESSVGERYPWSSIHEITQSKCRLIDSDFFQSNYGNVSHFLFDQNTPSNYECMDIHQLRKRLPDDVAREIIKHETNCTTVTDFQKLPLLSRNKNLLLLHQKGLSIRQLNRLTGVPKGVIDRIVTKGQSS